MQYERTSKNSLELMHHWDVSSILMKDAMIGDNRQEMPYLRVRAESAQQRCSTGGVIIEKQAIFSMYYAIDRYDEQ